MLTDLWEGEAEREQWDTDPFMSILTPCDPTFHQLCPQNTVLNLPDAEKREIRGSNGSRGVLCYSALCWVTHERAGSIQVNPC